MGQHALQDGAALVQQLADGDQVGGLGLDAGAMAVGIDFDHHLEDVLLGPALGDDGFGGRRRIDQEDQGAAPPAERQRPVELLRRDADGIENVGEARGEELLGLLQGRDGDARGPRFLLATGDLDALRCLDVGAQAHAEPGHARLQAGDVACHARLVDQRGRRFDVHQRHGEVLSRDIRHGP